MTNQEVAKILFEIGLYYEMKDVPFKPRAYEKAARSVESLSREVKDLYSKDGLKGLDEIPAVGKGIAAHIEEALTKGIVTEYEKLKKEVPVKLSELTAIEGVGPKMIKTFYKKLKVKN